MSFLKFWQSNSNGNKSKSDALRESNVRHGVRGEEGGSPSEVARKNVKLLHSGRAKKRNPRQGFEQHPEIYSKYRDVVEQQQQQRDGPGIENNNPGGAVSENPNGSLGRLSGDVRKTAAPLPGEVFKTEDGEERIKF